MNDRDVLSRAASELRAAHSGRREGAGFTRARVMNTLHERRQRKLLRWAILAPLVSALVGGSAWAQSNGQWPVIWQTLAIAIGVAQAPQPSAAATPPKPHPTTEPAIRMPAPAPVPAASAAAPAPAVAAAPAAAPPTVRPSRSRTSPSSTAPAPAPSTAPAPPRQIPSDPELSAFRSAHELHVAQDRPREAIDAFARYLERFPSGRFVPEARYNTALNQIRLGEKAAARRELEPFAAGHYGHYRQSEAQRLLDALR